MADYLQLLLASIDLVQELVAGKSTNTLQINEHQCRYLAQHLSKTKTFWQERESRVKFMHGPRRKALLYLYAVIRKAEILVQNCCCEESSWLEVAVTLLDIKEDVVGILLDLRWWTSMVDMAIPLYDGESNSDDGELEFLRNAEEMYGRLSKSLHLGRGNLQDEVFKDRSELLAKLAVMKKTLSIKSRTEEPGFDQIIVIYLENRLNQADGGVHSEAYSLSNLLNEYKAGKPLGQGSYGPVLEVTWLKRRCALKFVKGPVDAMEATILSELQHPRIIRFFHYWVAPYTPDKNILVSHILLELMSRDLKDHIAAQMTPSSTGTDLVINLQHGVILLVVWAQTEKITSKNYVSSTTGRDLKYHFVSQYCESSSITDLSDHSAAQYCASSSSSSMGTDLEDHSSGQCASPSPGRIEGHKQEGIMPFSLPVAIDIMLQLAEAMWYLIEKKMTHRDLKTANVLVRRVNDNIPEFLHEFYLEVELADFGLAKQFLNSSTTMKQPQKKGTTVYGAPEVFGQVVGIEKYFPPRLTFGALQ